jgi:hypothetical protein
VNLIDNLIITPSANYEISLTSGNGFSSNFISLPPTAKTVNATTIYVRLKSGLQNNAYFENISITTSNAPDHLVSCQGTVNIAPFGVSDFVYVFGEGPSAEKTFTVSGFNLTDNILVNPPLNFEISIGTGNQFVATNPIVLTPTNGTVNKTIIYARLKKHLEVNPYFEKVVLTSNLATEKSVLLIGKVDSLANSIANIYQNSFKIIYQQGGLKIQNLKEGIEIEIFNSIGQKIKSILSNTGDNFISLSHGIYFIKANSEIRKVILQNK